MSNRYVDSYIESVLNNNASLVHDIKKLVNGMCVYRNYTVNDLNSKDISGIRKEIYKYLDYLDTKNAHLYTAKMTMNKWQSLAQRYASTMVQGDNFNINEAGRNNGGSKHSADSKCIKLLEFQAEYQDACDRYMQCLAEKNRNTAWLRRIFETVIPDEQINYKLTLVALYCDDYSSSDICKVLRGGSVRTVHDYKYEGVGTIAKAVKRVLVTMLLENDNS